MGRVLLLLAATASCALGARVAGTTIQLSYHYLNDSLSSTRSNSDVRNAAIAGAKNGSIPLTATVSPITYSFGSTPCTGDVPSELKDDEKSPPQQCTYNKNTTCYRPLSDLGSFSGYSFTGLTAAPGNVFWTCSGKKQFCCAYECCEKIGWKKFWTVLILCLVFILLLPCIICCICCLVCKFCECACTALFKKKWNDRNKPAPQPDSERGRTDMNIQGGNKNYMYPPRPIY